MSNDDIKQSSHLPNDAPDEQPTAETSDDEETIGQAGDEQDNGGGLGLVGTLILIVLIVGIAGAAGYYWYQQDFSKKHTTLIAEGDALKLQLAEMQAALATVVDGAGDDEGERIDALESELGGIRTATDKAARQQQQLEKSVAALYQQEKQSSLDWVLAEAEYLVLAANQRLALEGDVNTAIAALRAADQRLNAADHPDLIPIRDQLIEDASALEAVKLPDIEGLAIYLAKIIEQVDELPTKPLAESVKPFAETKQVAAEAQDWRRVLNSMWTDLVELVEVKDAALPDSVLFDPELKYFLQQNLKIELASARLAALSRDGENFRASAALVQQILSDFYDQSASSVTSISERLSEAAGYEFEPTLPRITTSLDVIRARRGAADGG